MVDTGTAGTGGSGTETAGVVAAVGDLIFGARVRGAAGAAGVAVRFVRTPEELHAAAPAARCVLLDLDARWLDAPEAIRRLRSEDGSRHVRIIAFASHVRTDAITAARAAGADRVLARSAFVQQLPGLLRDA